MARSASDPGLLDSTTIERFRLLLDEAPAVRLAVLFGSAARGTAASESDLDVGVILDDGTEVLSALGVALERAAGRTVDLVALNEAPPLLRFEVARDGRLLLAREPHTWSDFRARAMIDWWDWAPTAHFARQAMMVRLREGAQRGQSGSE